MSINTKHLSPGSQKQAGAKPSEAASQPPGHYENGRFYVWQYLEQAGVAVDHDMPTLEDLLDLLVAVTHEADAVSNRSDPFYQHFLELCTLMMMVVVVVMVIEEEEEED